MCHNERQASDHAVLPLRHTFTTAALLLTCWRMYIEATARDYTTSMAHGTCAALEVLRMTSHGMQRGYAPAMTRSGSASAMALAVAGTCASHGGDTRWRPPTTACTASSGNVSHYRQWARDRLGLLYRVLRTASEIWVSLDDIERSMNSTAWQPAGEHAAWRSKSSADHLTSIIAVLKARRRSVQVEHQACLCCRRRPPRRA